MKNSVSFVLLVLLLMMVFKMWQEHRQEVIAVPPDVCLIPGECVVFNWNTSIEDIDKAFYVWMIERGDLIEEE